VMVREGCFFFLSFPSSFFDLGFGVGVGGYAWV